MESIRIEALDRVELIEFLVYLKRHVAENGDHNNLSQPLSKAQSILGPEWEEKFATGFSKSYGQPGWRKVWVAKNRKNEIVGHIDIRSRKELNTEHRVLLGMGVDSHFRKLGIGQKLLQFVINYCKNQSVISWIDLEVLTGNVPAIKLYEKMEFQVLSTTVDMFRIDNVSYSYTAMTLRVAKP